MKYTKLSENLSVAPQIAISDIAQIAKLGFGTIICNRPDNEDDGQIAFALIAQEAAANGLLAIHQPITGPTLSVAAAREFGKTIAATQKPVFGYCRTGTRCTTLWAINERENGANIDELAEYCNNLGYNIAGPLQNLH